MKKALLMASLLGVALLSMSCGDDDKHRERTCDAGFHDGCEDGYYVYCELKDRDHEGRVISQTKITLDKVEYVCQGDLLVPNGLSCERGLIVDSSRPDVSYDAYCDGNRVLRCDKNLIVESTVCESGASCVEYERGEYIFAHCYADKVVKTGCEDGVTAYGSCTESGSLKFCSSKDPSKGKTIELDCKADGMICRLIEDDYGYDCTTVCSDNSGEYTVHGTCKDNTLTYCYEGKPEVLNCSESNKKCEFDVYQYDCI